LDGRRDPGRIVRILREIDADIIGLQEVDSRSDGGNKSRQLDYLANGTGLSAVDGPTIRRHNGRFGNVLLTRRQILNIRRLDLSVQGREPRGAIDVEADIEGEAIRVIVTHLGLRSSERRHQLKRLLAALSEVRTGLVVVLSDINEWLPVSRPLRVLHAHLGRSRAPRTFPSPFPLFALDRIWVWPKEALVDVSVHRTLLTRIASDHLPLKAIITTDAGSNVSRIPRRKVTR
jgi:endonuclease/exonuclease/phosphatase family metal-dependent hydrolase